MYYTYILRNKSTGSLYIGYTNDLRRRAREHRLGSKTELIYYEAYQHAKQAQTREQKLKFYGSAWRALKQRITA